MSGVSLSAIVGARPAVKAGLRRGVEHAVAVGYGLTYDAIVSSFPPYQALLDEVAGYASRSIGARRDRRSAHVLDVAAGVGTLAFRLAREGYTVVGVDGVEYLIEIAREKRRARRVSNVAFHRVDIGADEVPWREAFDFAVSLHTLYWHPRPDRVLTATRRALRPGGHALFLNYARPARVGPTFQTIKAGQGLGAAVGALRWLVPTALFEGFRDYEPHYMRPEEFNDALSQAGFEILEAKQTFLADISCLAWVRRAAESSREPSTVRRRGVAVNVR
jgi:2-polyprenyl-3-methyl-5-hydroxy-6-metoxy-1,4-benzoquinol methylase